MLDGQSLLDQPATAATRTSINSADIRYVEIGSAAGRNAALPAHLLRSRRIEMIGAGAGSHSIVQLRRELPRYLHLLTERTVTCTAEVFELADVARGWTAAAATDRRVVLTP